MLTYRCPAEEPQVADLLSAWLTDIAAALDLRSAWRPAGGRIRLVIVREDDGWLAYFCTEPAMPVVAILEAMADSGAIEQLFKDIKEMRGAGQQQVRKVYASIGACTVSLVLYTAVEAWAWGRDEEALVDRSRSP